MQDEIFSRDFRVKIKCILAVLVSIATQGCLVGITDGREIPSRSSPVDVQVLYPEYFEILAQRTAQLKPDGSDLFSILQAPDSTAFFITDAEGINWRTASTSLGSHRPGWFPNDDPSHPNAKYRMRLRVQVQAIDRETGNALSGLIPTATFHTSPEGVLDPSSSDCMLEHAPQGGDAIYENCSQGETISFYALAD